MATRIGLVATLRETVAKSLAFVNYHLNVGVEHLFLFFDDPDDPAAEMVSCSRVTVTRCDDSYWKSIDAQILAGRYDAVFRAWGRSKEVNHPLEIELRQVLNATTALAFAKERGLDWLFHVDGDELIYARGRSLHDELIGVPDRIDFVRFPVLEAVPERLHYAREFSDIRLFRRLARSRLPFAARGERLDSIIHKFQIRMATAAGCKRVMFDGKFFRAHNLGKSATRVGSRAECILVHRPLRVRAPLRFCTASAGRILHYDCVTYDGWVSKWQLRFNGVGTSVMMGHHRKMQGQQFVELFNSGDVDGLVKLYKSLYWITAKEQRRLALLGMLCTREIAPALFERTPLDP